MALRYYLILKSTKTYEAILQLIIHQDDTTNGVAHLILKRTKTYEAILQFITHQDDTAMTMPNFVKRHVEWAVSIRFCTAILYYRVHMYRFKLCKWPNTSLYLKVLKPYEAILHFILNNADANFCIRHVLT
jgi:hypothetical protein